MPTQVEFTFQNLADDYCFTTPQKLATDIASRLSGSLAGNSSLYIISQSTPVTTDEDKLWQKLNSDGSPERIYNRWNGQWVALHSVPSSSNIRHMWVGTAGTVGEGELGTYDGGDGPGAVTFTSGAMWEVDTLMEARFPFGVGTTANNTVITVTGIGGVDEHTLLIAELPAHTHDGSVSTVAGLGNVETGDGDQFGRIESGLTGGDEAHQNLPPYYGVYFIKRTTRTHYVSS